MCIGVEGVEEVDEYGMKDGDDVEVFKDFLRAGLVDVGEEFEDLGK